LTEKKFEKDSYTELNDDEISDEKEC